MKTKKSQLAAGVKAKVVSWCRPQTISGTMWVGALVFISTLLPLLPAIFGWVPITWTYVSYAVRENILIPSIIAGLIGVWAARVNSKHSVICGPGVARSGGVIVYRNLRVLALVTFLAYSLGLIPLAIRAFAQTVTGGPDFLVYLSAAILIWTSLSGGYLTGVLFPRNWAFPISLLLVITASFLPQFLSGVELGFLQGEGGFPFSWMSIAATWGLSLPDLGMSLNPVVSAARFFLFLIVGIACAMAAGYRLKEWRIDAPARSRRGLALLVVPMVFGTAMVLPQPALVRVETAPPISCRTIAGGTAKVCLLDEQDALAPSIVSAIEATITYANFASSPVTYLGRGVPENAFAPDNWSPLDTRAHGNADDFYDQIVYQVAEDFAGMSACSERSFRAVQYSGDPIPSDIQESTDAAWTVIHSIVIMAGATEESQAVTDDGTDRLVYDEHTSKFTGMTVSEFGAWTAANEDRLRTCTLQDADLP